MTLIYNRIRATKRQQATKGDLQDLQTELTEVLDDLIIGRGLYNYTTYKIVEYKFRLFEINRAIIFRKRWPIWSRILYLDLKTQAYGTKERYTFPILYAKDDLIGSLWLYKRELLHQRKQFLSLKAQFEDMNYD